MALCITLKPEDTLILGGTHMVFKSGARVVFPEPADITRIGRDGKETDWRKEDAR